jgi:hypothetical protein
VTKVLYIGILSRDLRCFRVLATIPLGDRRESRFASRVGIGSDLAVGQIRRRPSRVGAPHGANYDAYANSERVPRPWRDGFASLTGQTRQGRVLRRIFAFAKILVSDFCVRKNPSVGFLRSQKSERLLRFSAKVASLTGPLQRTREGCARICPRTNPTSGRLLR